MKTIVLYGWVLLTVSSIACKKKYEIVPASNEVNATVLLSTGATITIRAKGSKAGIGCSMLGGGTFLHGTGDNNAYVYLGSIYGPGLSCVSSPGTFNLLNCEYKTNVADAAAGTWSKTGTNRGSVTFTTINEQYMEGHFTAVCYCASAGCGSTTDSVVINGTFKKIY